MTHKGSSPTSRHKTVKMTDWINTLFGLRAAAGGELRSQELTFNRHTSSCTEMLNAGRRPELVECLEWQKKKAPSAQILGCCSGPDIYWKVAWLHGSQVTSQLLVLKKFPSLLMTKLDTEEWNLFYSSLMTQFLWFSLMHQTRRGRKRLRTEKNQGKEKTWEGKMRATCDGGQFVYLTLFCH